MTQRMRIYTESLMMNEDPHSHHGIHRSKIYEHSKGSHWVRLDENTIVGIATLSESGFHKLMEDHEHIVIYPHHQTKITVKDHLLKKNKGKHITHFDSLQKYGINSTDTVMDMIAKLSEKGHTFLEP